MEDFIVVLPREANYKDFRVLVDKGGYWKRMNEVRDNLRVSYSTSFELIAQRDFSRLRMKVIVNRESFSQDGAEFRFDGSIGELLTDGGHSTGNFYELTLGINPSITQGEQTVGVLRMEPIGHVSTAS